MRAEWHDDLDESTRNIIESLRPHTSPIDPIQDDSLIDIDDETDNLARKDTKEIPISEKYKKKLINNISLFLDAKTYEQTLPSFVDFSDAVNLHDYPHRTLSFQADGKFYEVIPGTHICLRCGHIDVYANGKQHCKNCNRTGLKQLSPNFFQEPWCPYPAPRKIDPWTDVFQQIVDILEKTLYYDEKILYVIHALWIMASYRQQDFDTAPYLQFIAPISSGKTRALEVTSRLAYRGVLYATISPAALCREINKYHVTPCVDQAEFNFDTKTESGRENYSIWMCGYRKGQFYTRASQENSDDVVRKDVFGFKALASTRDFDEALSSRSIIFNMKEGDPEVKDVKMIMPEIQRVRMQLLYFHLLDESPLSEHLDAIYECSSATGRLREIYQPLIAVADFLDIDKSPIVSFIERDKIRKLKVLQESLEGQIVMAIKEMMDEGTGECSTLSGEMIYIPIKDIADRVGADARVVGRKLNVLNLEKTKTREGRVIDLSDEKNQKQLQYLFKKYGLVTDTQEQSTFDFGGEENGE